MIQAGQELGEDVEKDRQLYEKIRAAFRKAFPEYRTQTECVLAAHFKLAPDPAKAAAQLAGMVKSSGVQLETGFVGTPYLLHVLSDYGYHDLAYSLLLRRAYPSWLYPVTKGATTIWEHWDGIGENGEFWSADMNSYNHYAYGAVADWVYGAAAGIRPEEAGYGRVRFEPLPDERLDWLEAEFISRHGRIVSRWTKQENDWRYELETPVEAVVVIGGIKRNVQPGRYLFYSPRSAANHEMC